MRLIGSERKKGRKLTKERENLWEFNVGTLIA